VARAWTEKPWGKPEERRWQVVGDARRIRSDRPIRQGRIEEPRKRRSEKEVEGEPVSPEHGQMAV